MNGEKPSRQECLLVGLVGFGILGTAGVLALAAGCLTYLRDDRGLWEDLNPDLVARAEAAAAIAGAAAWRFVAGPAGSPGWRGARAGLIAGLAAHPLCWLLFGARGLACGQFPSGSPEQVQVCDKGTERLTQREAELEALLGQVDPSLKRDTGVRMEDGDLIVTPLEAKERPESAVTLERLIDERLPRVELSELLVEVDGWTGFTSRFAHASGREPRSSDPPRYLHASILAQGCNHGLTRMAQICDYVYDRLAWCTTWYLREETLRSSVAAVVNFQHHQPMSRHWGGGTLSSSDGQRFPVAGKVRNATALPRYFGYGKGVTFYTWTSDQFSQYGTKVTPATVRDATYVLDEILDNETELSILEHTTDTAGYTEIIFALFDLLGLQFSPRIRDLDDQQLYRLDRSLTYPNLKPRLKGRIRRELILRRWDDLLRVAGSLKRGWVTASLLISRLRSYRRQPALIRALQEYGRLVKTIFILRYLESDQLRRRINTQLNKGESLHSLREFLFFAHRGKIRRKQEEEQMH